MEKVRDEESNVESVEEDPEKVVKVEGEEEGEEEKDLLSRLEPLRIKAGLTWLDVTYTITKGSRKKKTTKTILDHLNGYAKPGEMTAILGGSGAGKTSLLNVLAGRVASGHLEGSVAFNGKKRDRYFRSVAAFVEQDDVIMPTMTVRETLRFAAYLRLPKTVRISEKNKRVEDTLLALGLATVAGNRVGDVDKRGVSGGERKRTSIGIELLTNPSLLFLDEPTSGLDSFNAFNLVELLGRLAKSGRTIIMAIHQPRANIFELFDKVIFLSGGKMVYFGSALDAVTYFSKLDYICPTYTNPADYVIDISTIDARSPKMLKESQDRVKQFQDIYLKTEDATVKMEVQQQIESVRAEVEPLTAGKLRKFQASFGQEILVIANRNWLNLLRDKPTMVAMLSMIVIISLIVGAIFYGSQLNQSGVQNRLGALFFLILNQVFLNINPRLNTFDEEFGTFKRERAGNTYRAMTYYLARTLVDFTILVLPLISLVICYFMVGFQNNASTFFTLLAILCAIAFCARSFGLAICALCGKIVVAQVVTILLILLFMLFGGFYSNTATYLPGIGWIQYLSFVNYAFKAVVQNEFTGLQFACSGSTCAFKTGVDVINFYNAGSPLIWINFIIVLAWGVFYQIVGYLAMKFRSRPKKKFLLYANF